MFDALVRKILPNESLFEANHIHVTLKEQRSLIFGNLTVISLLLVFAILQIFQGIVASYITNGIGAALLATNLFIYNRFGKHELCAFFTLIIGISVVGVQHSFMEAEVGYNLIWVPVAGGFAFSLLSKRNSYIACGYTIVLFSLAELNRRVFHLYSIPMKLDEILANNFLIIIAGTFVAYFLVGILVKEQKRVEILFEARNKESLKLMESKSAMLAILSHDIGSPLGIITGYADLILEKHQDIEPQVSEKILKISRNGIRIAKIIEMVRQMESVGTGKLKIQLSKTSIGDALEEAVEILSDKIEEKNISINFIPSLTEQRGVFISADSKSLAINVFQNIISNGLKFSNKGSELNIFTKEIADNKIQMKISDFGVGMSYSLLSTVFSTNKPTTRVGTAGETGTGFGLPLTKVFMDIFEGTIEVSSSVEKGQSGTTFTLVFNSLNSITEKSV